MDTIPEDVIYNYPFQMSLDGWVKDVRTQRNVSNFNFVQEGEELSTPLEQFPEWRNGKSFAYALNRKHWREVIERRRNQ